MDRRQFVAMLELRWRLTINQWRRGGQINAIIAALLAISGISLALVGSVAGFFGGYAHERTSSIFSRNCIGVKISPS